MLYPEKLVKVANWRMDISLFLKECFPNHYSKPFAPYHIEIFNILKKYTRVAIAAPRKHGKTESVTFGWVIWNLFCNPDNHFTIIISNNYNNVLKCLAAVKDELENNALLKEVFGDQKSDKWAENEIELVCKKKIVVGGNDFKVRGQKYLQYRPDLIVIDDPEDDEMVRSKERRDNFEHYILYALEPAMCMGRNQIIYIDTIKHRDSQLSKFLLREGKYLDWDSFKYQAWIKENEIPLWDELEGTKENTVLWLQREKAKDPMKFSQEYMNEPVPYEHAMFKPEYFDDYKKEDLPKDLIINITVDLACTDKTYSDFTVVMPVGIDSFGDLWILPYFKDKYTDPDKIIDQILNTYLKYAESGVSGWKFGKLGIEKTGFQRFLINNFIKARKKKGLHFSVEEIEAKGDKVSRISRLQPWFASGDIHIRPDMLDLKEELLDFPRARHDDISDALSFHLDIISRKPVTKVSEDTSWKITPERQRNRVLNRLKNEGRPLVYNKF